MVLGLVLFAATILALRRRGVGVLERYRYTIAAVGIGLTVLPRVPVIGEQVNGAYLDIHVGSVSFQPAELGKVAIVIFLASYLRDNRQILVTGGRRVLGVTIPPMKQFGPMLLVWGAAMGTLLLTGELGTSLMFYGAFLALLYVATGRLSFPLIGLVLFALGAWFVAGHVGHVHARVLAWEHPLEPALFNRRHQLPARPGAVRAGRRGAARHRLRPVAAAVPGRTLAPRDRAPLDPAGAGKRHDLRGHHRRARPRRRRRPADRLPAVRRPRPEDGDAGEGLLLEAARHGPVVHRRDAGVRDRRRRHARDPADGGDAPVRRLRGLLGGDELRAARAAAARLRPRAAALLARCRASTQQRLRQCLAVRDGHAFVQVC